MAGRHWAPGQFAAEHWRGGHFVEQFVVVVPSSHFADRHFVGQHWRDNHWIGPDPPLIDVGVPPPPPVIIPSQAVGGIGLPHPRRLPFWEAGAVRLSVEARGSAGEVEARLRAEEDEMLSDENRLLGLL